VNVCDSISRKKSFLELMSVAHPTIDELKFADTVVVLFRRVVAGIDVVRVCDCVA
jgi:hypothetical protein